MAKHKVSRMIPALFHPEFAARNGRLPQAHAFYRLASAYNQIATRQRKLVFQAWQDFRHMVSTGAGTTFLWPFYFRTGENVDSVRVFLGLTPTEVAFASPPRAEVRLDNTPAFSFEIQTFTYASSTTGTAIGSSNISHVSGAFKDIDPDTEYEGLFSASAGMRIAYATVVEADKGIADDDVSVIVNPTRFLREGPILASHLADLQNAGNKLWRHNSGHLMSWCPNYRVGDVSTDFSTSSTSYVDVVSSTFYLPTTNRGTLQRPNAIPVKMAVRAYRTAGTGTADFRIFDGTNSVTISGALIGSGLGSWFTGTGTLSGTPATWRMQARVSSGTTTVRINGWSLFQYEA